MLGTLRIQGTNENQPFVYAVGLGVADLDEDQFCGCDAVEIDGADTITFTYDRQSAAEYGMAHAYRNSTLAPNLVYSDNQNRLTSRLDNNNPTVSARELSGTRGEDIIPVITSTHSR